MRQGENNERKTFSDIGKGGQAPWWTSLFSFRLNFVTDGKCCGIYHIHDIVPYVSVWGISAGIVSILMVKFI